MPITPPTPIAGQVGPSGNQPYVSQMNFGQMIGAAMSWNPNCDGSQTSIFINNAVRKLYDRRLWYGLLLKGQLSTPPLVTGGTVSVTVGSPTVTGTGTSWTANLVGRSLRVGYTNPIYNIIAVNVGAQTLTLELPWAGITYPNIGYFIAQYYYSIPNIKYIYSAKNLQLQYRLWCGVTQEFLDNVDPSRLQLVYTKAIASMPPDKDGNWQCELWPASTIQQALPYLAYVQPPNLVNDSDVLPAYIRADIIVNHAIADVLRYRMLENKWYPPAIAMQISKEKMAEFESEALRMEWADEQLLRQDIITWEEQMPMADLGLSGAMWDAMSPVLGGGW